MKILDLAALLSTFAKQLARLIGPGFTLGSVVKY